MTDVQQLIAATVARAPDWLKQGLLSKEGNVREEAEETLAAMIASAIATPDEAAAHDAKTAKPDQ